LITDVSSNPRRFAARRVEQRNTCVRVAAKRNYGGREKTSKFSKCCGEIVEKKKAGVAISQLRP
jgi:hypothetical protein